jgi:hypothetical protein
MPVELDLISPADKPALLAVLQPETMETCKTVLNGLGFKVHAATDHNDFTARFARIPYQVVIIDETFACATLPENQSLQSVQTMPMNQRRHAAIILVGDSFQTLNVMQAFQQSVHAVVRRNDLANFSQILQQVVADNNLFLNAYREVQTRMAQGKI